MRTKDPNVASPEDAHWALLARYLAGEVSEVERQVVDGWARADPARAQELRELEHLWALAHSPCAGRVDAMWESLSRRIRQSD